MLRFFFEYINTFTFVQARTENFKCVKCSVPPPPSKRPGEGTYLPSVRHWLFILWRNNLSPPPSLASPNLGPPEAEFRQIFPLYTFLLRIFSIHFPALFNQLSYYIYVISHFILACFTENICCKYWFKKGYKVLSVKYHDTNFAV